jgi:hypothetical protein
LEDKSVNNTFIWTCFEVKWRTNHKEGIEHETKRKTDKEKTKIKMRTTDYERYDTEGRKWDKK